MKPAIATRQYSIEYKFNFQMTAICDPICENPA